MSDPAAPEPLDATLYQQSMEELKSPRPIQVTSVVFSILMLVFVLGLFINLKSVTGVALLVAALALHEGGHALGMRLFGFRDIQMFFIPFFGAAVTGRERGAATWKEAAVSLMGPVPGLLIGLALVLYAGQQRQPVGLPFQVAGALVWLNAFNMLPLGFLDGGRFLEHVLFSRHRFVEIAFQVVGYLLLGILAIVGHMYVLGIFSLLALVALPARWRVLREAARLRRQCPALAPDPDRLDEPESQALFVAAQAALGRPANEQPAQVATTMASVLRATRRAPGVLATLGLLVVYGLGLFVAVSGIVLLRFQTGPVEWQTVQGSGWRAEFPRRPSEFEPPPEPGSAPTRSWSTTVEGIERFRVEVSPGEADERWMNASAAELARQSGLRLSSARPVEFAGHRATEFELTLPRRVMRSRMLAAGSRHFRVTASAPTWGKNQQRFLDSFTLTDSTAVR